MTTSEETRESPSYVRIAASTTEDILTFATTASGYGTYIFRQGYKHDDLRPSGYDFANRPPKPYLWMLADDD
jgi:hypothetical protein